MAQRTVCLCDGENIGIKTIYKDLICDTYCVLNLHNI